MLLEKLGIVNKPKETEELCTPGVVIHKFTRESFLNILKEPNSVTVRTDSSAFGTEYRFDTQNNERVATTRIDDPAVLAEIGASNCTLCVTFDNHGNGSVFHQPLVFPGKYSPEYETYQERLIHSMVEKMTRDLDIDSMQVLITGNNGRGRNPQRNLMKKLIRKVLPREKIFFHHPSEGITYARLIQPIRDVFVRKEKHGYIPNDPQNVSGVIFVPRQLSLDDKNHIFFLHDDNNLSKPKNFNLFVNELIN